MQIITLTKLNPSFLLTGFIEDRLIFPEGTGTVKIELMEITNVASPSSITIVIQSEIERIPSIRLFKHRGQFLYQNDIFILDTKAIPEFIWQLPPLNATREAYSYHKNIMASSEPDEDFIIKLYYSTGLPV